MNIDLLINAVVNKNKSFKTKFYDKTIKILETIGSDHNKLSVIFNESDYGDNVAYILEAYKQFLIANQNDLECCLISDLSQNNKNDIDNAIFIRPINLSNKALINLFKQILVLENNSNNPIEAFMEDPKQHSKFTPYIDGKFFFVIKHKNIQTNITNINEYTITNEITYLLFLGIETFDFLEHQNVEHMLTFIKSSSLHHKKSTQHFSDILSLSKLIDSDTRDRIILFSGITLQILGANYTKDVDIIYYSYDADKNAIDKIKHFSVKHQNTFDFKIYNNNSNNTDNIEHTLEIMVDPTQYFYFLGMKFMSVSQFMQRCYMRSVSGSYVDLIMLNKINNYQIDLCLPTIVSNYGLQIVYDYDKRNELINEIVEKLHRWFNINVSKNEIHSLIHSCTDPNHDSMIIDQGIDPTTYYVMKYLVFACKELLYKYVTGDNVLEVDRYKTRNLLLYPKLDVKNLTILEDSKYMRNHIEKVMIKYKDDLGDMQVNIVDGSLTNLPIDLNRFDTIIVRHDLEKEKNDIDSKIISLVNLSHKNTIVIVIMMDGEKINDMIADSDYIMKVKSHIKFAIWKLKMQNDQLSRDDQKIAVFMERIFEYDKGFVQDIVYVDDVVNKFNKNGFDLINKLNFTDVTGTDVFMTIKKEMLHNHKIILDLFCALIFKKN